MKKTAKEILQEKEHGSVKVIYADNSEKTFDWNDWKIFRDGIIDNLYNKNLCNIVFEI